MTDAIAASTPQSPLQVTIHPLPQSGQGSFFSGADNAPTFKDVLDTINPLEHIPIVSTIYNAITGNTPSAGSKIAGGALFGGVIGLFAAVFDNALQSATGADFSGNVMAAIEGKPIPALQNGGQQTQTASDAPPDHLSANQRMAYNAYVNASMLT